jgi:hypothetical protein
MTLRARIDVDAVYHDSTDTTLTVGALSEHLALNLTSASSITASAATTAMSISGATPLSTLVVKNTGTTPLRLAGAITLPAGRVAVIPTTATITVAAPSGAGSYSCLWMG